MSEGEKFFEKKVSNNLFVSEKITTFAPEIKIEIKNEDSEST
jgi:hypothetical protein